MIKSLKEILRSNLIRNIYFTKFHSLLRFGILCWGGAGGELTSKILQIQKRVIRLIAGVNPRTPCRQLFKELNILTIVSLYILEVISYLRRHRQFVELNSNVHTYNTRRKRDIHIQSYKTDLYRVSQEERAKLREGVPYVKLYRYNPEHLYPKLNGFRDNGK